MSRPSLGHVARSGFSLIELMLVLAIMAITAALAVPRYAIATDRYRADAAARRIAADVRWAHSRAIAVGAPKTVSFDPTTSTYSIAGETDPDRPGKSFKVALAEGPYAASIVSADFNRTATVSFNGYGVCPVGGTVVIRSGSCTKTIQIDVTTGTVTVQ